MCVVFLGGREYHDYLIFFYARTVISLTPGVFTGARISSLPSLRSMAVLLSRAHERRSQEKNQNFSSSKLPPQSPRGFSALPRLLRSAPNQNRHATQASPSPTVLLRTSCYKRSVMLYNKSLPLWLKVYCGFHHHYFIYWKMIYQ